jgi:hypothetical protein
LPEKLPINTSLPEITVGDAITLNPPVPVLEKLVMFGIYTPAVFPGSEIPVTFIKLEPNKMALILLVSLKNLLHVKSLPFKSSVPDVNVNILVVVNASPNITADAATSIVIGEEIETLSVVTVPEPLSVNMPVADHVVVADKVIPSGIVRVPVDVRVQVAPVVVNDAQLNDPDNVIVGEPELLSITTLSFKVGTACPPLPPEVRAQFVVLEVSHVPFPPTQ